MLAALAASLAGGLVLAACGIPIQHAATPLSSGHPPISLPPTRTPSTPCSKSGCVTVDVYFVTASDRLAPVGRVVPRDAKLATVVRALLTGPTASEGARLTTALGADVRLLSTSVTSAKNTATVDFNTEFLTLSGTKEVLGVAQVVFTVTSFLPGAGVTFEIGAPPGLPLPIEVPLETGQLAATPVHESQYATLRTSTTPTTTTTP